MPVALTTYPTNREDAGEAAWSSITRPFWPDGVFHGIANELETYADGTSGMAVKVKAGEGSVRGFHAENTALRTVGIPAAHATLARIDRIVLRLNTAAPATVSLDIITGTPSSSPQVPGYANGTPVTGGFLYDAPLATVAVGAGASTITAGNVTLGRQWTGKTPWQNYASSFALVPGSALTLPSGSITYARYQLDGMTCHFAVSGLVGIGGTSTSGNPGGLLAALPKAAAFRGWPLVPDAVNDIARSRTASSTTNGPLVYADMYRKAGETWPTDGVQRGLAASGTYEIALS